MMTTNDEAALKQLLSGPDPTIRRVTSDLERACASLMPRDTRAAIAQKLTETARQRPSRPGTRRVNYLPRVRPYGLASFASAAVIVLGSAFAYVRLQTPTPASAAQILHLGAVAAADVPAGDVVHETIRVQTTFPDASTSVPQPNDSTTVEQWTQVDAHGGPLQFDIQASSPNQVLDERVVGEAGGTLWTYGAKPDFVTKDTWTPGTSPFGPLPKGPQALLFLPKETMNKPQDPAAMRALLRTAASGADGNIRLLPEQSISGQATDVVQITSREDAGGQTSGAASTYIMTIYLDANTHLVRRIQVHTTIPAADAGPSKTDLESDQFFDVTSYQILPLSRAPAGTFTFAPADGTKVCSTAAYQGPDGATDCTTAGKP